jgi:hypothetical protein
LRDAVNAPAGIAADPDLFTYAAPELILGSDPTSAFDLYSLGAIMFELATGETFPSANNGSEAARALDKLAGVPKILGRVIATMLSADPAARPTATRAAAMLRSSIEGTLEADLRTELGALVQRLSQNEPRPISSSDAADAVIVPDRRSSAPPRPVMAVPDEDEGDPGKTREASSASMRPLVDESGRSRDEAAPVSPILSDSTPFVPTPVGHKRQKTDPGVGTRARQGNEPGMGQSQAGKTAAARAAAPSAAVPGSAAPSEALPAAPVPSEAAPRTAAPGAAGLKPGAAPSAAPSAAPRLPVTSQRPWLSPSSVSIHDGRGGGAARANMDGVPVAEMPPFTTAEVAAIFPPEMQGDAARSSEEAAARRRGSTIDAPAFQAFEEDKHNDTVPPQVEEILSYGQLPIQSRDPLETVNKDQVDSPGAGPTAAPPTVVAPHPAAIAGANASPEGEMPALAPSPRKVWLIAGIGIVAAVAAGLGGYLMGARKGSEGAASAPGQPGQPPPPRPMSVAIAPAGVPTAPAEAPVAPTAPPGQPAPAGTATAPVPAGSATAPVAAAPSSAKPAAPPAATTAPPAKSPPTAAVAPDEAGTPTAGGSGASGAPVTVTVTTTPPGAMLWFDGKEYGRTPFQKALPSGSGQLLLVRAGFQTVKMPIIAKEGLQIDRKLVPGALPPAGTASVKVVCRTQGKFPIIVDGTETGLLCTVPNISLAPGPHDIAVFIPGSDETHRWKVQLRPGPRVVGFKL